MKVPTIVIKVPLYGTDEDGNTVMFTPEDILDIMEVLKCRDDVCVGIQSGQWN